MTKFHSDWKEVLRDFLPPGEAALLVKDLRAAGWIVVRHDAIRLAQAHASADVGLDGALRADNDNVPIDKICESA
jgi:hypothetical protein